MAMQPIRAGEYRHRVSFQSCSTTPDSFGQQTQTWTTYATARAKIAEFNAKMIYQTDDFVSESTYKMELRYLGAGVTISALDRAVDEDGVIYVIDAPLDSERRHRKLVVLCHVIDEAD